MGRESGGGGGGRTEMILSFLESLTAHVRSKNLNRVSVVSIVSLLEARTCKFR